MKMKLFLYAVSMISALVLYSCKSEKIEGDSVQTSSDEPVKINVDLPQTTQKSKTAPKPNPDAIKWMSIDQIEEIESPGSKMYLIDIYTEWCGWCKIMDKKTFSDPRVQERLNNAFHLVKFDAENKETVKFNGKSYAWKQGGRRGNNELAIELLKGRMSYPSLVFLDKDLNPIKISAGYKNPEQMIQELEIIAKS